MGADLVHFDIPAESIEALSEFYGAVLGWRFESPGGFDDYRLIFTSEREGAPGGGMHKKELPQETVINYYEVDSISDYTARVKENGGQVVMDEMPVPGFGYLAVCLDPEGNPFGLWVTEEGES